MKESFVLLGIFIETENRGILNKKSQRVTGLLSREKFKYFFFKMKSYYFLINKRMRERKLYIPFSNCNCSLIYLYYYSSILISKILLFVLEYYLNF